jgi:YVTN family beta-propeller protein
MSTDLRVRPLLGATLFAAAGVYLAGTSPILSQQAPPPVQARFAGPTSSQTLALDANGSLLIAANPDNNTVSLFSVELDQNRRLREIQVGREPWGVALNPQGTRAYVANTVSGTVTVLAVNRNSPNVARTLVEIPVGTEPYGLAMTPNGSKLYVTNRNARSVSVIDTASNKVKKTIQNVGLSPRGIAITNDGDGDDDDETVFVTDFFALPREGRQDGEDDAKQGIVTTIRTVADEVETSIAILPIGDTGFKAAGSSVDRVPQPATPVESDFRFTTSAYPNQLNNIALKGNYAYLPSVGASPNGPLRFDVNTQSLLSVIDLTRNADSQQTINMHAAVKAQTSPAKLFITVPWAIAAKHSEDEAYVVSASSDVVVKVGLSRANGAASVINDPSSTAQTKVLQIPSGKNPRGIVINSADTRAYVMNYISRDITVLNIERGQDKAIATMRSAALPAPGSGDDVIHAGKELYNTSVGEFDGPSPLSPPVRGRMSANGWGSCASCHPDGLSDNVVWIFGGGPRRTISQHSDFDPDDQSQQRALNWSGERDEQEDFELNVRNVSGGLGLLVGDDGITPVTPVANFAPGNAGRRQLRIRGLNAWDVLKAYVQVGIRSPISPVDKNDPDVVAGEQLFRQSNCQSCHGGATWSSSRVTFPAASAGGFISNAQIIGELRKVGTFDPAAKNEVRERVNGEPLGADGFVPPSLLSLFLFPKTFFHNGSVNSLEDVMANVQHRSAGTNGADLLTGEGQRRQLIRFLLSIDGTTPVIPPR